jgi:ribonuclease VapC
VEPVEAGTFIARFLSEAGIAVVPIEPDDADAAIRGFTEYGKGRGHPARLNLADCLAYACAKRLDMPLLYKGDDFAKTDMA